MALRRLQEVVPERDTEPLRRRLYHGQVPLAGACVAPLWVLYAFGDRAWYVPEMGILVHVGRDANDSQHALAIVCGKVRLVTADRTSQVSQHHIRIEGYLIVVFAYKVSACEELGAAEAGGVAVVGGVGVGVGETADHELVVADRADDDMCGLVW